MTILVRDASDIIKEHIEFHRNHGVDFFIITDNGSIDGTREILEEYSKQGIAHIIDEPEHNYSQVKWVHNMVMIAKEKYHAQWVINNDSDEFWYCQTGNLKDELKGIHNLIYCRFLNYYPLYYNEDQNKPFYENTALSYNEYKKPWFKCIHKTKGYKIIHSGNHHADMSICIPKRSKKIKIFHFPIGHMSNMKKE
jgi:hypothetical protein